MNKEDLQKELENFNKRLDSKDNIDENLKDNLKKLMDDISNFLENSEDTSKEEKDNLVD